MRHGGLARAFVVVVFGFSALPLACGSTQEAVPEETTGESQQALGLCQVAPGTYIQCPGSSACCNNVCVDLATSNSNCGACGATCGRPNVCGGGHCCTYGTSWCATEGACIAPCDCPPDLASWLTAHPNVAAELKWQPTATASETNGYEVAPGDKQAYASWPVARKLALALAFNARYSALCKGQRFFETLPDPLPNAASNIANDGNSPATHIDAASAEALYIAQVAHSLAVELGNFVPWSVSAYDSQSLAVLFDSSSMMRLLDSVPPIYSLGGWYSGYVASKREHNQGRSLPAPPPWATPS